MFFFLILFKGLFKMKRIHFVNLYSKSNLLPVLFGVVVIFILYAFLVNSDYEWYIMLLLNGFALILLSRVFWYKILVQYNTDRISMRINSKRHLTLKFDDLTEIRYNTDELLLTENTKRHRIGLDGINPKDIQKLIQILVKRSDAVYKDLEGLYYYE